LGLIKYLFEVGGLDAIRFHFSMYDEVIMGKAAWDFLTEKGYQS
jgi:hypothetical protein